MKSTSILSLVSAALLLSACGGVKDPCADIVGSCISALVDGDIPTKRLDQLRFTIDKPSVRTVVTPMTPEIFELPVRVAIVPPANLAPPFNFTASGYLNEVLLGQEVRPVTESIDGRFDTEFYLNAIDTDGGAGDASNDGGRGDGGSADLSDSDANCLLPVCGNADVGRISNECGTTDCGPGLLTSVAPTLAQTGQTLVLEGRFGPSATVNFPGGVTAAGTVQGPNRVTVTVPFAATAGALTVTTSAGTTNARPFRRASFALAPAMFSYSYPQGDAARWMATLNGTRTRHNVVRLRDNVYTLGGVGPGGILRSVERARINADDTLGNWRTDSAQLITPRRSATSIVIGDRIYVLGGGNGSDGNALTSVEYTTATVATGALATFADAGVTLTTARAGATAQIIGPYLYVIGGNGLASVERAHIRDDFSLDAFESVPLTMTVTRFGATTFVLGANLYVLGGVTNAGFSSSIEHAPIMGNGALGAFVADAATLTVPRAHAASVQLGSRICLFGGENAGGGLASTECAGVNSSAPGAFAPSAALHATRSRAGGVLTGNSYFLVGGASSSELQNMEYTSVNASGALGAFGTVSGVTLATQRFDYAQAVIGDFIYLFGGRTGAVNTIERARVLADGSISSFTALSATLVTARAYPTAIIHGAAVYVAGGDNGAATAFGSIERALINDDGSLGAFTTIFDTITARSAFAAVFARDTLWMLGGKDGAGTAMNGNYIAYANTAGLNTFQSSGVPNLSTARSFHRAFVSGDLVYLVGGSAVGMDRGTINQQTNVNIMAFAGNNSLVQVRQQPALTNVGTTFWAIGGFGSAGADDTAESATLASPASGAVNNFAASAAVVPDTGVSNMHATVIGNTLYLFGGVLNGGGGGLSTKVYSAPLQ